MLNPNHVSSLYFLMCLRKIDKVPNHLTVMCLANSASKNH